MIKYCKSKKENKSRQKQRLRHVLTASVVWMSSRVIYVSITCTCSLYHLSVYVAWLFCKDSRFKQDLAGPARWIASTSHPLHVTRLIAERWPGQLSCMLALTGHSPLQLLFKWKSSFHSLISWQSILSSQKSTCRHNLNPVVIKLFSTLTVGL